MANLRAFVWNKGNIYDLVLYRKYKEMKEDADEERDSIVMGARKRMSKYNNSINHSIGALNTGRSNWLYEKMKHFRGICG